MLKSCHSEAPLSAHVDPVVVYYNDQHQNPAVIKYRDGTFYNTCKEVGKRLPLYVIITEDQEKEYRAKADVLRKSMKDQVYYNPLDIAFKPGREWDDEGTIKYVHHVDELPGFVLSTLTRGLHLFVHDRFHHRRR